MNIEGANVLVLGGAGLVGSAACRALLAHDPRLLVVAARRRSKSQQVAEQLQAEFHGKATRIVPVWGDVFLRAEWQSDDPVSRSDVLKDPGKRHRMIADVLGPLDEDIIRSSMLCHAVLGTATGLDGSPADMVIDCMNTATAVSYQNLYAVAGNLAALAQENSPQTNWPEEVEPLLASLYIPQLVRHIQLLHEAMRRASTRAYLKVGTSGTGGMGFNIPYTHGEEKPSRLLLSKAALAGAQTLLTFLMARTPGGPEIVKEIKPAAVIGWKKIGHGPISRRGQDFAIYDCPPDQAVSVRQEQNLVGKGEFGQRVGGTLEGVYVDLGENGLFSAAEFSAITTLGQMELVTPEEIAANVVRELLGGNTGRDVVSALDGAVMGPSFRGGYLRQAALDQLRELEAEHGEAVAFEILGPPRLSKLLFEAFLLKRACRTIAHVLEQSPEALSAALEQEIADASEVRRRALSIGIPILLSDGERLLRGPVIKVTRADHGWIDLTSDSMGKWRERLAAIRERADQERDDTSSRLDRMHVAGAPGVDSGFFDIGEIVAWILSVEDAGQRGKR